MVIHLSGVSIFCFWSILCWNFKEIHYIFMLFMIIVAVWNGSSFYNYFTGKVYEKALVKVLDDMENKKKK